MTRDRISASILALFALLVILESRHLPLGTFRQPGPAYVPVLLASLLLIFGVLLMLTGGRAPALSSVRWAEWRHALAILAACVFAVFAIERLGYRITIFLMLGFLVKAVEKRGWVSSLIFCFSLSLGSYFLFYTLLRVPLPQGPLGF
jgi:Tripartite tricarboxylate transporter TctB family